MAWNLDSDRPIYTQLVERIQLQILSGYYPPGGRMPSVRELASEAAVNPNTMQKAFADLERTGLIITQRTNGRTVTEDEAQITAVRNQLSKEQLHAFLSKMQEFGYSNAEVLALVENYVKGSDENQRKEGKIK